MNPEPPKHTSEPWEVSGDSIIAGDTCIANIETDGGYEAPGEERNANAARIVACVNACAGIADPSAALATVREKMEAALLRFSREYKILTDDNYGTIEEFLEVKAARTALALLPAPNEGGAVSEPSIKPQVQITRAQADSDNICITIQGDDGTHLRVEVSLKDFADMITGGRKTDCVAIRWRLP